MTKSHLAIALLLGSAAVPSAFAGAPVATAPAPTPAPAEINPLSFFGSALVVDIQGRLRVESRENNFDFNKDLDSLTDDTWLLTRFRLGLTIKPVAGVKIVLQAQDSREIGSDRDIFPGNLGAEGDDTLDLRFANIQFGPFAGGPLSLTLGRQALAYGDQRLVGAGDWTNFGRIFDAAKLRYETKTFSLDAFAGAVVNPRDGGFNESKVIADQTGNTAARLGPNDDSWIAGLYATFKPTETITADAYLLYKGAEAPPSALGDTSFATVGARYLATYPCGIDTEAEAAYQFGEVLGRDLSAFAAHLTVGYTWKDAAFKPRLAFDYAYATGDSNPADNKIETFQNLYPTNHRFYGNMDVFSWQNLHDLSASLKLSLTKELTFQIDQHAFWLATTDDAWYRSNGSTRVRPLNALARAADSYAGAETDINLVFKPAKAKWIAIQAGYSYFAAGKYLDDTGADSDAHFGYLQTTITF